MIYPISNTRLGKTYARIDRAGTMSDVEHRWIGRCKTCGKTQKIEGHVMLAYPGIHGGADYVIQTTDGRVYFTTGAAAVKVPCGDHWCVLKMVEEGTKASKHTCGARCTSATGPNCDCRCRGKNHGSNC